MMHVALLYVSVCILLVQLVLVCATLLNEEFTYSDTKSLSVSVSNVPQQHGGVGVGVGVGVGIGVGSQEQERRMRLYYLEKKPLFNTSIKCNDGTPTFYYIRKSDRSSNWLIFLEGGSYCFDDLSCNERQQHDRKFTTSSMLQANWRAVGILSGDRTENPLYADETIVMVPYCSSDLWTGSSVSPSNVSNGFYFMGSLIIKELVQQLLATENIGRANRILLSGSSAGGFGALLNFHKVKSLVDSHARRNRIHPAPAVRALVDSSWFLSIIEQDVLKMDRLLPAGSGPGRTKQTKQKQKQQLQKQKQKQKRTKKAPKNASDIELERGQRGVVAGKKKKQQCGNILSCRYTLQETMKSASIAWKSDLPHDCTRLASNENRPWRCFYPFVLLRSMQKSKNPIPVFILQYMYDRVQIQMDFGFSELRVVPAYIEALRDKMRTTLLKTKPLFVGIFAPACFGHGWLTRNDWFRINIRNTSVIDTLRCWEHKLNMRNQRVLSSLAKRTNVVDAQSSERGFWTIRTISSNQGSRYAQTTANSEPKCNSRLFELDSYPLSNPSCPKVMRQSPPQYRFFVDRITILREFGYSESQINRLLNLTDQSKFTSPAPRRSSARRFE